MQGLGLFWMTVLYVCVREKRGLDSKTILSFVFRKIKPQKMLIFKKHLYQRQIAVFQSAATCSSFCHEERLLAGVRKEADGQGGTEAGGWECSPGPV